MTFIEPEGATPLDPDERQGLKFLHITTRIELDELEQTNIEQGLPLGINPSSISAKQVAGVDFISDVGKHI